MQTQRKYVHKVLYRECDMMQVLNNAVYVSLMEDARVEALSSIGCNYKEMEERGYAGPVMKLSVSYARPARFGDELEITVTFVRYTGVRLCLSYDFRRSGELLATASSEHCFIDMKTGSPSFLIKTFPDWHKALLGATE